MRAWAWATAAAMALWPRAALGAQPDVLSIAPSQDFAAAPDERDAARSAEQDQKKSPGFFINVINENDLVNHGNDFDYSQGLSLSLTTQEGYLFEKLRLLKPLQKLNAKIAELARQEEDSGAPRLDGRGEIGVDNIIFTPRDLSRVNPDPSDRPYAGLTILHVGALLRYNEDFDQISYQIGSIGPRSGAGALQRWWHDDVLSHAVHPSGWASQIPNRWVAGAVWQHAHRLAAFKNFDVTNHFGASVSSITTYADAGATLRIGALRPSDYGVPRIEPSLPGSGYWRPEEGSNRAYVFAGFDVRYVTYDVTLDERPRFGPSTIDRLDWVADAQVGAAVYLGGWRLAYTHVFRTKQFRQQHDPDGFGALSVTIRCSRCWLP